MSITIIASRETGGQSVASGHQPGISHISPDLTLRTGTYRSPSEAWYEEPLECGLRLVLVQSGSLRCRVPGQQDSVMNGPSLCMIANEGDFTSAQVYGTDHPLRYTIVQFKEPSCCGACDWLPKPLQPRAGGDPRLVSFPAPRALQVVASQIATCQLKGGTRDLYLGGKALELTALGMQFLADDRRAGEVPRVTSMEVERIHSARDRLIAFLDNPPTLEELAHTAGMNRRKLTQGFRSVFGASVFEYLQEYRLREAHRLLCSEELNVSTVAYRVGYSPAHFATAFRKRFGVSPSEVR